MEEPGARTTAGAPPARERTQRSHKLSILRPWGVTATVSYFPTFASVSHSGRLFRMKGSAPMP
jgi:hypothetical protein